MDAEIYWDLSPNYLVREKTKRFTENNERKTVVERKGWEFRRNRYPKRIHKEIGKNMSLREIVGELFQQKWNIIHNCDIKQGANEITTQSGIEICSIIKYKTAVILKEWDPRVSRCV